MIVNEKIIFEDIGEELKIKEKKIKVKRYR